MDCLDHWHCDPHLAAHNCYTVNRSKPCPSCGATMSKTLQHLHLENYEQFPYDSKCGEFSSDLVFARTTVTCNCLKCLEEHLLETEMELAITKVATAALRNERPIIDMGDDNG